MSLRTPTTPVPISPVLLDNVLSEIQTALTTNLTWLDSAFGKAQKLKRKMSDGREITYPAVYAGQKDYLNVFPDSHIGNFCFFDFDDGHDLTYYGRKSYDTKRSFGLVFWFNLQKVYPSDWTRRTTEHIKKDVFDFFRDIAFTKSEVIINDAFEEAANIYKGYSDKEIDNQFLMRPYSALRVEGTIIYNDLQKCS